MFSNTKSLTIPEGEVSKIESNGIVIWQKAPDIVYNDLVPTALYTDGAVFDGVGYRRGVAWTSSGALETADAFTAIGLIPIDGSVTHDLYVYGLDFSGTAKNRFVIFNSSFAPADSHVSLKDGYSGIYATVTKLDENYFKITTKTYSSKIKYFSISGVTASGIKPIVTMDEPIK